MREAVAKQFHGAAYKNLTPAAQRVVDAHVKRLAVDSDFLATIEARENGSLPEDEWAIFRDANHTVWLAANAEYCEANAALNEENLQPPRDKA